MLPLDVLDVQARTFAGAFQFKIISGSFVLDKLSARHRVAALTARPVLQTNACEAKFSYLNICGNRYQDRNNNWKSLEGPENVVNFVLVFWYLCNRICQTPDTWDLGLRVGLGGGGQMPIVNFAQNITSIFIL